MIVFCYDFVIRTECIRLQKSALYRFNILHLDCDCFAVALCGLSGVHTTEPMCDRLVLRLFDLNYVRVCATVCRAAVLSYCARRWNLYFWA